ncbi:MAG: glutamate-5-semialdehyde dehydrogenase [Acidimicrobiales bacterium]
MPELSLKAHMCALGDRAVAASTALRVASTAEKDEALFLAADELLDGSEVVLEANSEDVAAAVAQGIPATVVDRLRLDKSRIESMVDGLRQVAALADPVGEIVDGWVRPNGLEIRRVRVPLGVVAIIYENRPNVTSDALALCLKSGNVAFLRGSSSAIRSNTAVSELLRAGIQRAGLPADSLVLVDRTSREAAQVFMQLRDHIDVLIPRGGKSLINSILEHASVPYVIDGDGNCHVYVHRDADLGMALEILDNAKTQRPSVCNAAESLVVHRDVAAEFLAKAVEVMASVEFVGDAQSQQVSDRIGPATDDDYGAEFLDLKLSVKVVDNLDAAIDHVNRYSSGHSEAIITNSLVAASRFQTEVDAAAVLVNASTRFVDGEQFGFGAEIGISTQKLHARGPMGLTQLTTTKYLVQGTGQIRG